MLSVLEEDEDCFEMLPESNHAVQELKNLFASAASDTNSLISPAFNIIECSIHDGSIFVYLFSYFLLVN